MSEVEKHESQKTVVAFITGLLIGGLLVWVFSSTPDTAKEPEMKVEKEKTEEVMKTNSTKTEEKVTATTGGGETKTVVGEGKIAVADQKAGSTVELGEVTLPIESGWIVVRDYMDGVPGNILGAARFSVAEGLMPESVDLVRSTTGGGSYQIVFFTNEGDITFTPGVDRPVDGVATTFKAN